MSNTTATKNDTILFDGDGLTMDCPKVGFASIEDCKRCERFRGSEGFIVYCEELSDDQTDVSGNSETTV